MNKKYITLWLVTLFSVAGCTSTPTATATATTATTATVQKTLPIKLITESIAKIPSINCKFIGVTIGNTYNNLQAADYNIEDAQLKAANEAKSLGANAAVLKNTQVSDAGHDATVTLETYHCDLQNIARK